MIHSGLVSITFRKLSPSEIIRLVAKAGLEGIEWGGDIHVPHGQVGKAREVLKMTEDAGLTVASYGSYYFVGCDEQNTASFEDVLETAAALHAPIRVWAGNKGSLEADASWREKVIVETRRISGLAKDYGVTVSFEFHGNTLTDTAESAVNLLKSVKKDNIRSYWQPPDEAGLEQNLADILRVLPWLSNIHIFWSQGGGWLPLRDGAIILKKYIDVIGTAQGDRFCMIEFVKGDDPHQFLEDADALKEMLITFCIPIDDNVVP